MVPLGAQERDTPGVYSSVWSLLPWEWYSVELCGKNPDWEINRCGSSCGLRFLVSVEVLKIEIFDDAKMARKS